MADNVAITAGSGTTIAADEVSDGTLGSVKVQYVKIMSGTIDGTDKAAVSAAGNLKVDASGVAVPITDNSGSLTVDNGGTFAVQSDVVKINGTATSVNNGTVDAGTQRVTIASNSTGQVAVTGSVSVTPSTGIVTCTTSFTRPNDTTAYNPGDAVSDSTSAPTSGGFTFTSAASGSGKSGTITDLVVTSSAPSTFAGEVWIFDTSVTNINDNIAFAITDGEVQTLVGVIPFACTATTNNSMSSVSGVGLGFTTVGSANLRFLVRNTSAYTPIAQEVFTFRLKVLQVN